MNQLKSTLLHAVILLCASFLSHSQVKNPKFKFNKINKPLKQNGVINIVQDNYGYLWVATLGGLHRFDGMKYEVYESTEEPTSLSHSEVRNMLVDSEGSLWLGSIKGLCRYNRQKNNFHRYELLSVNTNKLDERNSEITSIVEDAKGTVWVSNIREGLFYKISGTDKFEEYDAEVLKMKNITSLYPQNDSILWIGTLEDGIVKLNHKSKEIWHYPSLPNVKTKLSLNTINSMIMDKDQNLYIGGFFGINRLSPTDSVFHNYSLSNPEINELFIDSNNRLWACGVNSGLFLYNRDIDDFILFKKDPEDPTSIPSNSIWKIYEDRENRLWLGSTLDGLIVIDKFLSQFDLYDKEGNSSNELSNHYIRFLHEDEKENLWIATDGGGLNYLDRKTNKVLKIRHDPLNPKSIGADAILTISNDKASSSALTRHSREMAGRAGIVTSRLRGNRSVTVTGRHKTGDERGGNAGWRGWRAGARER